VAFFFFRARVCQEIKPVKTFTFVSEAKPFIE